VNAGVQATAEADIHYVDNGAGWRLALKRVRPVGAQAGRPVLIVPGYQMNSSVFGYHPNGLSLEEHLASRGLEVWSVDLRGQGRAIRTYGDTRFGIEELAIEDLGAAIAYVRGVARADAVDILGCSLGTALAFAHLACVPDAPVGCIVAMGGVVTWAHVNRSLRLVARAPWLVGQLRMRGTRKLARAALPVIARMAPGMLSFYLNVESTDVSNADEMVKTVEDPNPVMNRQIATWLVKRELTVRAGFEVKPGVVPGDRAHGRPSRSSQLVMIRAMRGPACPSHSGGSSPAYGPSWQALRTAAASSASVTSRLLPLVMVMGRSVFGRMVRHGTRSKVVSSCTPPESVITAAAPLTRAMNSR